MITIEEKYRLRAYTIGGLGFVILANLGSYEGGLKINDKTIFSLPSKRFKQGNLLKVIIPFVTGVYATSAIYHISSAITDPIILSLKSIK